MKRKYYFQVDESNIKKTEGDFFLLCWYSALLNYSKRLKRDGQGYVRIFSSVYQNDFNLNRAKVWRMNRRLEELGLIQLKKGGKGAKDALGFKILR